MAPAKRTGRPITMRASGGIEPGMLQHRAEEGGEQILEGEAAAPKMRVSRKAALAAKVLNDWMKRCAPTPARNSAIAQGPPSVRCSVPPSPRCSQKHSAEM